MGKPKTDPKIEQRICDLKRNEDLSLNELVERTGVPKGTIRGILERNGLKGKSNRTAREIDLRTPAPTMDTDSADSNRTPNRTPSDDSMSGLSQQMIAKDLVTFLNAAKRGIVEIRRSNEIKNYRDRSQMEAQWMHLYGLGIKMGIKATGLSAEALVTATEDFEPDITSSLERFNSVHRKEEE